MCLELGWADAWKITLDFYTAPPYQPTLDNARHSANGTAAMNASLSGGHLGKARPRLPVLGRAASKMVAYWA